MMPSIQLSKHPSHPPTHTSTKVPPASPPPELPPPFRPIAPPCCYCGLVVSRVNAMHRRGGPDSPSSKHHTTLSLLSEARPKQQRLLRRLRSGRLSTKANRRGINRPIHDPAAPPSHTHGSFDTRHRRPGEAAGGVHVVSAEPQVRACVVRVSV